MNLEIKIMPPNYRPEVANPDTKIFETLGEDGIRKLISDHYDLLAESPIKEMFPPKGLGLDEAKQRSADFFIQKLGGPDYFSQKRGNPMLSKRHSYFKITPEGRVEWLKCYRQVILKLTIDDELKLSYWNYIHEFSNWMVNSESEKQKFYIK